MEQPEGYGGNSGDGTEQVCLLLKSLYGLKQSPRNWNHHLHGWLESNGWAQSPADPGVYLHGDGYALVLYVDDIIVGGPKLDWIAKFKRDVQAVFKIKDLGAVSWCLGMEVTRDRSKRSLVLTQHKYITDMLKQYNMTDSKAVGAPMATGTIVATTGALLEDNKPYQSLVGSLLYAAVATRPDIAQAVSKLARMMSKPEQQHWELAKRVLRYLKGTAQMGLHFSGGTCDEPNVLVGYSDADWAGEDTTRRSTTGYV
jgi:hypothetical protein